MICTKFVNLPTVYLLYYLTPCLSVERPHIVMIVADDLGWNDVSFHGSLQLPTPNIDALALDGIILNNYYVSPICTPSRGALMTGKHPIRLGLQHNVIAQNEPWGLSFKEKILPQHLKELGYVTRGIGKWHLGFYKEKYLPFKRGFDSFYGYWGGLEDYYTHFSDVDNMTGLDLHDNMICDWDQNSTYGTDLFTLRAVTTIKSHDISKPLFLYLSQQAVHSGNFDNALQAPDKYVSRFPHITDEKRKIFAGMVSSLDDCVGNIVSALLKTRMLDDTIILFTSDNGGSVQGLDGTAGSNWPLRGGKYNMWEGGVRAVAFLWSARLRHFSHVSNQMMHITDWLPTLFTVAGGDVNRLGPIDGINLWDSIIYNLPSPRHEILHNIDPIDNMEGVRKRNYKLIKGSTYEGQFDGWYDKNGKVLQNSTVLLPDSEALLISYQKSCSDLLESSKVANILKRRYDKAIADSVDCFAHRKRHLIVECGSKSTNPEFECKPNEAPCLFDVDKDPCEYHNIAQQLPEIVKELQELLDTYRYLAAPPRNKPGDLEAYPKYFGNCSMPWK